MSVFIPNTGKHGTDKTPYLDTFYAVHSTRNASSSKLVLCDTKLSVALNKGGCSSDSLFGKKYNLSIKLVSVPLRYVNNISTNFYDYI